MDSLLDLTPTTISRDLRGKIVLLYGEYKSGKTSTAVKFPGALLLGFEKGYNALGNIYVKPMQKWSDFKAVLSELHKPAVQDKFQTIIVDTADLAWNMCVKYICGKHNVKELSDVPWGKAYQQAEKEFEEALNKIVNLNYGLVMISHDQDKVMRDSKGIEYNKIIPTLDKRARNVILRMTDINGYVRIADETDEKGYKVNKTMLYLRGTNRFEAGSRFATMPEKIVLSYDNLVDAINAAIDAEEANGVTVTTEHKNQYVDTEEINFDELKAEVTLKCKELAVFNKENVGPIKDIIANHMSNPLADATELQVESLKLIKLDLEKSKDIKNPQ